MSKLFLSCKDQIAYLENQKGLLIQDHGFAEDILKRIGYFRLIGGYKTPFKNPTTRKYNPGVKFEDIVALYSFDERLRELFFKYILQIEIHVRTLLSYYFSQKYGENQARYLNAANYIQTDPKKYKTISGLIQKLTDIINNSDYAYINHYRKVYGNIPLWVLINAVTFGTLSKFYSCITSDLRSKIAINFTKVNDKELEQFLNVLTKFRNVCAHNERLYSFYTKDDIPDKTIHAKMKISKKGTQYICGKRDLFAVVVAFKYLLPDQDFLEFKKELVKCVNSYLASTAAMTESALLKAMGFPWNWKRITLYKK